MGMNINGLSLNPAKQKHVHFCFYIQIHFVFRMYIYYVYALFACCHHDRQAASLKRAAAMLV